MRKEVTTNCWVAVKGFEADGREETYFIVPANEADVFENKIPEASPLAQTLIGARVGDTVSYHPPAGPVELTIVGCGSRLSPGTKPSRVVLYHCQKCGHVVVHQTHAPKPKCCGGEMAYAAEDTVRESL